MRGKGDLSVQGRFGGPFKLVGPPYAVIAALAILGLVFFGAENPGAISQILPYFLVVVILALLLSVSSSAKGKLAARVR